MLLTTDLCHITQTVVNAAYSSSMVSEDEVVLFKPPAPSRGQSKNPNASKRGSIASSTPKRGDRRRLVDGSNENTKNNNTNTNTNSINNNNSNAKSSRNFTAPLPNNEPSSAPNNAQHPKKENAKQLLLRLQQEETVKQGQRFGNPVTHRSVNHLALDFARKGAGTDLRSPIGQGLLMLRKPQSHEMMLLKGRSGARKGSLEKSLAITGTEETGDETANGNEDTSVARRPPEETALKRRTDFAPVLADWQYRRWNVSDSHVFTSHFRRWLEGVTDCDEDASHPPRLEDQERFLEGELHLNPESETGVEPEALEYPPTSYDMSDETGAPHLHETSLGYMYNWQENVKGKGSFCNSVQSSLASTPQPDISNFLTLPVREYPPEEEEPSSSLTNPNIYLRPIENKDVPHVMDIYNWYIKNSVLCTETECQEEGDIIFRMDMCKKEKLPFIVAAQRKPGAVHAGNSTDEIIEGFIYATDFSGQRTVHSQTSQFEVYVREGAKRKAVGKCLIDKLLSLCDHKFAGDCRYDFDCGPSDRNLYCGSGIRDLRRLIVVVQFVPEGQSDFEQWMRRWLENYGFEMQALLKGVAVNKGKE